MCLGVPGKVIEIQENPVGMTMGRVSFAGIVKEVCLAYTPEVEVGDYVVVHVGFAISTIGHAYMQSKTSHCMNTKSPAANTLAAAMTAANARPPIL